MRCAGIVVVGLTLGMVQAGSKPGYLPVLGPAPLRFQTPVAGPAAALPPLLEHDGESTPTDHSSTTDTAVPPSEPASGQGSQLPNLPITTVATNAMPTDHNFPPVETNALPVITPQMLMQFFLDRGLTNRNTLLLEPPQFSPAVPPPASSSATYISVPKP